MRAILKKTPTAVWAVLLIAIGSLLRPLLGSFFEAKPDLTVVYTAQQYQHPPFVEQQVAELTTLLKRLKAQTEEEGNPAEEQLGRIREYVDKADQLLDFEAPLRSYFGSYTYTTYDIKIENEGDSEASGLKLDQPDTITLAYRSGNEKLDFTPTRDSPYFTIPSLLPGQSGHLVIWTRGSEDQLVIQYREGRADLERKEAERPYWAGRKTVLRAGARITSRFVSCVG